MFPYPSGDGLHVGHPEGYTATDIVCRAARMQGKSVMHPMGFDAFGLPAEEHAIKTGEHPRVQTEQNIDTFRRQLKMLGFSYDWSRELATTDVEYFRWTQWIFLQMFDTWFDDDQQKGRPISELPIPADVKDAGDDAVRDYQDEHRLAFQSEAPVNWCPALGTVLANEEVIDGKSERGEPSRGADAATTMDVADHSLRRVDWRQISKQSIGPKASRRCSAIGSGAVTEPRSISTSAVMRVRLKSGNRRALPMVSTQAGRRRLRVYTTRPDTLFGATYMVIAPEHPYVERLTTAENAAAVKSYCDQAAVKSDLDRTELAKEKTGVFTGSYAVNPANGEPSSNLGRRLRARSATAPGRSWRCRRTTSATLSLLSSSVFRFGRWWIPAKPQAIGKPFSRASRFILRHGTAVNSGDFDGLSTSRV